MTPQEFVVFIHSHRWPLADEKALQAAMETMLRGRGVECEREVNLGDGRIIDFIISANVGVEVKIKGARREIYRQIERYCLHDRIASMVLATNVATGMPAQINCKPVYVASLGRGWL